MNKIMKTIVGIVSTTGALLCLSGFAFGAKPPKQELSHDHPRVRELIGIHNELNSEVMSMQDVIGTAVGYDENGEPGIVVYVNQLGKHPAQSVRNVPGRMRGEKITVELTEPFHAFVDHTAKQDIPVSMGTSGGWTYDQANGFCCGGTLGSLVQVATAKGTTKYIMSNYHVLEADIVTGGNLKVSATGDPVIQPGLIDVRCSASNAQQVGTLQKLSSLPKSNVDVSLAKVGDKVDSTGNILEIGTISKTTTAASLLQPVKKSGRTTGLTRSVITGLNATVSVTYENECAGPIAFTKTFKGQIIIANEASLFLNSGDSGSLMVEDVQNSPKAVGLLFAGSSTLAVANPINEVLAFIGGKLRGTATMVGN